MQLLIGQTLFYIDQGRMHRTDGPAFMTETKQEWCQNGLFHRSDGPARLFKCLGKQHYVCEWWLDGKYIMTDTLPETVFMSYWRQS
jgi:hypothetical protein